MIPGAVIDTAAFPDAVMFAPIWAVVAVLNPMFTLVVEFTVNDEPAPSRICPLVDVVPPTVSPVAVTVAPGLIWSVPPVSVYWYVLGSGWVIAPPYTLMAPVIVVVPVRVTPPAAVFTRLPATVVVPPPA